MSIRFQLRDALCAFCCAGLLGFGALVDAQEGAAPVQPPIEVEAARLETVFETLLAQSEGEPVELMQSWGALMMGAVVLEARRYSERGEQPPPGALEQVQARLLERWQKAQPEAAGPELFRTFPIRDQTAKEEAILGLVDRYPDDSLLLWHAANILRQRGEGGRLEQLLYGFLDRHPERRQAYALLVDHWGFQQNAPRSEEILSLWAENLPVDADLLRRWLNSNLVRTQPELTRKLLGSIDSVPPPGRLQLCRQLVDKPELRQTAKRCLARLAGGEDAELAVTAASALAGLASKAGNYQEFVEALDRLPGPERARALLAAVSDMKAPEACATIIEWLGVVAPGIASGDSEAAAVGHALRPCHERLEARQLFLSLLDSAPTEQVVGLLQSWVWKVNDVWRGPLPATEAASVLAARLEREPTAEALFRGLDLVYDIGGLAEPHERLLQRWRATDPESFFRSDHAGKLSQLLLARGQLDPAAQVLREQLARGFDAQAAEQLWALYELRQDAAGSRAWVDELLGSKEDWPRAVGHRLAARQAVGKDDWATAETHYFAAFRLPVPQEDLAREYLEMLELSAGDGETVTGLAERVLAICLEPAVRPRHSNQDECATELLREIGEPGEAARVAALRAERQPESIRALLELGQIEASAERWEESDRAYRRVIELDPNLLEGWISLGMSYAHRGRWRELENLVGAASRRLDKVPPALLRSLGQAYLDADQPERAVETLKRARAQIEAEGGETGWVDEDLRRAYAGLSQRVAADRPVAAAPAPPAAGGDAQGEPVEARELLARAEVLYGGREGLWNREEAQRLFERAAATGDPEARLRWALITGLGGSRAENERQAAVAKEVRPEVRRRAEAGSAYAAYLLGTADLLGVGARVDLESARRWLEKAARGGQPWALHNLGWMRSTNRAFAPDETPDAASFYRKAAELGNVPSMFDLALTLLTPGSTPEQCAEGIAWLERAGGAAFERAGGHLGKVLFYGQGRCLEPDRAKALPWLERAAAVGVDGAGYDLGMALLSGGPSSEIGRALALIERAAEQPDLLAIETLAFLYDTGTAVTRDPEKARELRAKAAAWGGDRMSRWGQEVLRPGPLRDLDTRGRERLASLAAAGDPAAAFSLADALPMGRGGNYDAKRAFELAQAAARAGNPDAPRLLALAYRSGDGVAKDTEAGRAWFLRGAELGNSFCQMFYGQILIEGAEVERDLEGGMRWLTRAAEAGNWWAIATLGRFYDEGSFGLTRNLAEAARWKRVLAERGDQESRGWLLANGFEIE